MHNSLFVLSATVLLLSATTGCGNSGQTNSSNQTQEGFAAEDIPPEPIALPAIDDGESKNLMLIEKYDPKAKVGSTLAWVDGKEVILVKGKDLHWGFEQDAHYYVLKDKYESDGVEVKHGVSFLYEDGATCTEIIPYIDGVRNGAAEIYYVQGTSWSVARHQAYKDDKLNGKSIWYEPDGSIGETTTYADGKRSGEYIDYFHSGTGKGKVKEVGQFKENIRHGLWKTYFENGKIQDEGSYRDGIESGVWKYYYDNGKLEQEGKYRDSIQVGVWKYYDYIGELEKEEDYGE